MKDYKRLTKKAQEIFNYGEFYNKNIVDPDEVMAYCTEYDWCHGGNAIDRLAGLEDKIESGEIDYVAEKNAEIKELRTQIKKLKNSQEPQEERRVYYISFSERESLAKAFFQYAKENNAEESVFNTLTFLTSQNLLNGSAVYEFLNQKRK